MIGHSRRPIFGRQTRINNILKIAITTTVLMLAVISGIRASLLWLTLLILGVGGVIFLRWPVIGLLAIVPVSLIVPLEFGTGTDVRVNPTTLLLPALLIIVVLHMVSRRNLKVVPSRVNTPLSLFLFAGLLSLLIGNAMWDQAVPKSGKFILVQLAQLAIFVFSAGAFWLAANLVCNEAWLRRLTWLFLAIGGASATMWVMPQTRNLVFSQALQAPFWMLLGALTGGQLLFNKEISIITRLLLLTVLGVVLIYAFFLRRETASNWVSVAVVASSLVWLRWPRLRWPAIALILALVSTGILFSAVYDFAGGDEEWAESGDSRLALITRVIEVTTRNPITGLGPAAYRVYGAMKPLNYERAFWVAPRISSHNNYVDLFSHVGLLGLALFFWFAAEVTQLGFRLRARFAQGFAAGYVNSMLAVWAGSLVLMLFADWILPFVYNISFSGFRASILVWLFLGGLVALEQIEKREAKG